MKKIILLVAMVLGTVAIQAQSDKQLFVNVYSLEIQTMFPNSYVSNADGGAIGIYLSTKDLATNAGNQFSASYYDDLLTAPARKSAMGKLMLASLVTGLGTETQVFYDLGVYSVKLYFIKSNGYSVYMGSKSI